MSDSSCRHCPTSTLVGSCVVPVCDESGQAQPSHRRRRVGCRRPHEKVRPAQFEQLKPQPVISNVARDLGWQLFGDAGPPVLTPTIERRLAGLLVNEHHLGRCVGRRPGNAKGKQFLATVYIIEGGTWGYGPRGSHLLRQGDIATWHSSQDVAFQVEEMVRKVIFFFDVEFLGPLALDPALCDDSVSRDDPLGSILSSMFGELWRQLDRLPPTYQRDYHVDGARRCLAGTSHELEVARTSARELAIRSHRCLHRAVVRQPELSPASLADAHGISLRYLHLLFAQRGHTAAAWIRERRLAYCREVLTTADADLSVTEVAIRAGFSDPSHFSRLFRHRFGVAPGHLSDGWERHPLRAEIAFAAGVRSRAA